MSELPGKNDRVIKTKPKVDWPGVIEDTQVMNGETYFHVRFDDPGLDDEYLLRDQFIMEPLPIPKAKSVFIFPNGNVVVCDEHGWQIPQVQGSWINFDYLKKLAKHVATSEGVRIDGVDSSLPIAMAISFNEYVEYYKKNPEAE